jgi:HPt (histidine-containing phosphotransfer) domain-containing protein
MEMIELFIQNVPNDVALLGKAIFKQDVTEMKKMAHHIKSSLAMFRLDDEVVFLEKTERNTNTYMISDEIAEEFAIFKSTLEETIEALKALQIG